MNALQPAKHTLLDYAVVVIGWVALVGASHAGSYLPTDDQLAALQELSEVFTPPAEEDEIDVNQMQTQPLGEILDLDPGDERVDDPYFAVGDMLFEAETAVASGGLAANTWTGGRVYYTFGTTITNNNWKDLWRRAARIWETGAKIEFIELNASELPSHPNFVTVIKIPGNASYSEIGEGNYYVAIAKWSLPILLHEMGHVLGLIHEHQRSDRNVYVRVGSCVRPDDCKLERASINVTPYDFDSLMHYSKDQQGTDTIVPLPPNTHKGSTIGKATRPSEKDRRAIHWAYGRR